MDFTYTPEQEHFRAEIRRWLAREPHRRSPHRGPDRRAGGARPRDLRAPARLAAPHVRGGLGRDLVAQGVRRPRRHPDGAGHLRRGVLPGARPRAPRLLRHRHGGPDHHRVGHRGAEAALPAAHPGRRRHLVPGLLGAGRGLGPGEPQHPRRGPGRSFRRQRAEGVDLGRPVRGLDLPARAHRSRRAQAPRHQLPPGGHEDARHHGAPAGAAQRPPALQRGVLRRRGGAEGQPDRPAERGLEARDDHAHVRAQERRRARPRGAARAAARARHDGAARRPARVGASGDPPALRPARDRGAVPALHAHAQPDPPAPRRAARARGLDPQALRLRAGRAHRRLRGRAARPARAREPREPSRCPTARAGTTAC